MKYTFEEMCEDLDLRKPNKIEKILPPVYLIREAGKALNNMMHDVKEEIKEMRLIIIELKNNR